jgi:hypothetical protein
VGKRIFDKSLGMLQASDLEKKKKKKKKHV